MGMFDEVKFEGMDIEGIFQTKEFECVLGCYTISPVGLTLYGDPVDHTGLIGVYGDAGRLRVMLIDGVPQYVQHADDSEILWGRKASAQALPEAIALLRETQDVTPADWRARRDAFLAKHGDSK